VALVHSALEAALSNEHTGQHIPSFNVKMQYNRDISLMLLKDDAICAQILKSRHMCVAGRILYAAADA
jgi:hypothetical protein